MTTTHYHETLEMSSYVFMGYWSQNTTMSFDLNDFTNLIPVQQDVCDDDSIDGNTSSQSVDDKILIQIPMISDSITQKDLVLDQAKAHNEFIKWRQAFISDKDF